MIPEDCFVLFDLFENDASPVATEGIDYHCSLDGLCLYENSSAGCGYLHVAQHSDVICWITSVGIPCLANHYSNFSCECGLMVSLAPRLNSSENRGKPSCRTECEVYLSFFEPIEWQPIDHVPLYYEPLSLRPGRCLCHEMEPHLYASGSQVTTDSALFHSDE